MGRDFCEVPLDHLVGGERWRDGRFAEYVERLGEIRDAYGARERTVATNRKLARLVDFRVDRLIASAFAPTWSRDRALVVSGRPPRLIEANRLGYRSGGARRFQGSRV